MRTGTTIEHRRSPTAGQPQVVGEQVGVDPGRAARATDISMPGRSWPQPCGMLTTPGAMSSVTSTVNSTSPTRDVTWPAHRPPGPAGRRRPRLTRSVHSGLPFTSVGTLCIHELLVRRCRRPTTTNSSGVGRRRVPRRHDLGARSARGHSSIRPGRGAQDLRQPRLQRRRGRRRAARPSAARPARPVPYGAGAQPQVQHELLGAVSPVSSSTSHAGLARSSGPAAICCPAATVGVRAEAGEDRDQPEQDVGLVHGVRRRSGDQPAGE